MSIKLQSNERKSMPYAMILQWLLMTFDDFWWPFFNDFSMPFLCIFSRIHLLFQWFATSLTNILYVCAVIGWKNTMNPTWKHTFFTTTTVLLTFLHIVCFTTCISIKIPTASTAQMQKPHHFIATHAITLQFFVSLRNFHSFCTLSIRNLLSAMDFLWFLYHHCSISSTFTLKLV